MSVQVRRGRRTAAARAFHAALFAIVPLAGCMEPDPGEAAPKAPFGEAWPEADRLFRQDARWLGSDAAYSIPLGRERTLWFFGDTFIATSDAHRRDESVMVSNTIAIQNGLDPTTATMRFVWREPDVALPRADLLPREPRLGPQAFLPDDGQTRFWPAHGVVVEDALLVFWMRVVPSEEGLGFAIDGTRATLIDLEGEDPLAWPVRDLDLDVQTDMLVATMGVAQRDGWLYALSTQGQEHHAFVVRWPIEQAMRGELDAGAWWTENGWSQQGRPLSVFEDGAPEGSLHFDEERALWVSVQATGFGGADLDVRTAPAPEGPWSSRQTFFRPPESERPHTLVYAGKTHPELRADGVAVTYAQNAGDFGTLVRDDTIYWPRFVRLDWA